MASSAANLSTRATSSALSGRSYQVYGKTGSAEFDENGCKLLFDGAEFDFGDMFSNSMSPMEAAMVLIGEWKNGYIIESARETADGAAALMTVSDTADGIRVTTWFDTETLLPMYAELSEGGVTSLSIKFDDVVLE